MAHGRRGAVFSESRESPDERCRQHGRGDIQGRLAGRVVSDQFAAHAGYADTGNWRQSYGTVGNRFLVTENESDPRASTINVLMNWTAPPR